jgi:hypothetical protein|tara:strand:+ start:3648 stop:3794 length:147 start_codon:yes stop_codon:yes gene_type:complete
MEYGILAFVLYFTFSIGGLVIMIYSVIGTIEFLKIARKPGKLKWLDWF